MAIMNYHDWFHHFHQYMTGIRKGHETYNDTKWKNIYQRYQKLIEMEPSSMLLTEQPYNVVGNNMGFQMLVDLMERSNYTFEDLDKSLAETYRKSLQNAMSKMLVNTHAVIAQYPQTDKKHVCRDKFNHYYIVDVPFDQMHFGERDEFVRQKLHAFYETENRQYIPAARFLSDEMSSILKFTVICCTNGYMSDDWYVGIDEKGFRFKIGWRYAADVTFTIYKLDGSKVLDFEIPITKLNVANPVIRYSDMGIQGVGSQFNGCRCIVQISDSIVSKEIMISPNFGSMTGNGCAITNMQEKTTVDFERYKSEKAHVRIYMIKHFHEVSGVFPAVNYLDMMGTQYVYDDQYNHVTNEYGGRIHSQNTYVDEHLPICTPPISLNRVGKNIASFHTLRQCYALIDTMKSYKNDVLDLGHERNIKYTDTDARQYYTKHVINPAKYLLKLLRKCYETYYNGAIITSLINMEYLREFEKFLLDLDELTHADPSWNGVQRVDIDMLYGDNYDIFLKAVLAPLYRPPFSTLGTYDIMYPNYFTSSDKDDYRINRPVAEQCFIALKYNHDDDIPCWIFDVPDIKHFKGIENVFYVNDNLRGDELFKFFFLYTDTENPVELKTDNLTDIEFRDFDAFTKEVDRHIGYVKYWYVENQLMKLSKIYYQKHDMNTEISILSKIMKQKIDGDIFLEYPSEMNYEFSNAMTDNVVDYTEESYRAPFALNFLFYTLSMMQGNEDKLAHYLMYMVTRKKFYPRYADLKLSEINMDLPKEKINYSVIHLPPSALSSDDKELCVFPDVEGVTTYAGMQYPLDANHDMFESPQDVGVRYPFVFNVYENDTKYNYVMQDELDHDHYIQFGSYDSEVLSYYDDARVANIVSIFLAEIYDVINDFTTDYKSIWNTQTRIDSYRKVIDRTCKKMKAYVDSQGGSLQAHHPSTLMVANYFLLGSLLNPMLNVVNTLQIQIEQLTRLSQIGYDPYTIQYLVNQVLMCMRKVYECTGFKSVAVRRIRRLYLQLKKMNQPMSLHEYRQWAETLDRMMLIQMSMYYDDNPNVVDDATKHKLEFWAAHLNLMVTTQLLGEPDGVNQFDVTKEVIDSFYDSSSQANQFLQLLVDYCNDVMKNYIFDFYVMDAVDLTTRPQPSILGAPPAYAELLIEKTSPLVQFPDVQNDQQGHYTVTLHVDYEHIAGTGYRVLRLVPTCENAFVNGNLYAQWQKSVKYYDKNGNAINTYTYNFTFTKVSISSDILKTFERYSGLQCIPMEVMNVHERFDVNDHDDVVNVRHAELHYELLCGNHFIPLTHLSEYCNPPREANLQGPWDKLYLSCARMNTLSVVDQSNRPTKEMFFKPCHVYHNEVVGVTLPSLGGKYFVGQTVYAYTDDGLSLFPMTITSINHSQNHGILELKVDEHHARWFHTTDPVVMEKYLTTDVTCTIVNDNIRNFLDEFSEWDGEFYPIPPLSTAAHVPADDFIDCYSLPGDPIFVETNSDYVYTRLNWMFHDEIPNRLDETIDPKHHFVYIGSGDLMQTSQLGHIMIINTIRHDFNPLTNPELYPLLRHEPNDHNIWDRERKSLIYDQEKKKYTSLFNETIKTIHDMQGRIRSLSYQMSQAKTVAEKRKIETQISDLTLKYQYQVEFQDRLTLYMAYLETPSTWYNVITYDAAMVYISNGRAKLDHTFRPHIQDLPYTDQVEVRLYDWEHKRWLDPSEYSVRSVVESGANHAHFDDDPTYDWTMNVLTQLIIEFTDQSYTSKKILIYYVYDHSDIFDDITMSGMNCKVRFRPVLALDKQQTESHNPYDKIRLRKHYDENEIYYPAELEDVPEDFLEASGIESAIMFKRPSRSGLFTTGSPIRFCDMMAKNDQTTFDYDDFDIYVKHPISNITTDPDIQIPKFNTSIIRMFDGFASDTYVTLACVNNNANAEFNGIASSVMFTALITGTEGSPSIRVLETTADEYVDADFVCYIKPDPSHPMSGGVITVHMSHASIPLTHYADWVKLEEFEDWKGFSNIKHRLIPDEVILVPKDPDVDLQTMEVYLQNHYQLDTDHDVSPYNLGDNDLFTVYYDKEKELRYPVGNIFKNTFRERLTIDLALNQDVNTIRTNYIGICRYASQSIPEDGIIDLTGYIATPLSRDRYEFWVNGRFISDPDDIIILSPTSLQLRNLTSLRNLDIVELVDDVVDSKLFPKGNMYIDLDGNVYGSYYEILKRHANVMDESVQYIFNLNTKYGIDEYLTDDIRRSNNVDVEPDILDNINADTGDDPVSYNQLHHIPTINGVPIYHLTSTSMGFMEYSNRKLLEQYDLVWKRERLNGSIKLSHLSDYDIKDRQVQRLHVRKLEEGEGFEIYTSGITDYCFTLYISNYQNSAIDDTANTLKIFPFLRSGIRIRIDDSFENKWLISTIPNTPPIQIK